MAKTRGGIVAIGLMTLSFVTAGCGGTSLTGVASLVPRFSPRDFGDSANITNQWFPLVPGAMSVLRGQVRGVQQVVNAVVTNETKRIDGVVARAIADQEYDEGQLAGGARDYFAQDRHGNVWYLGEFSTHYVNGQFTDHADSWFAGVRHAKPGIIMAARPELHWSAYQQEFAPNISADMGRVIKFHQSVCVPLRCLSDTMEIEETSPLDPGVIEDKYYAKGIGMVRSVVVQGDPQESNLVSYTLPSR